MRTLLVIASASLLISQYGRAQQTAATKSQPATATSSGLECFEHMVTPEFPRAAMEEHVDGSVWTWTQVTAQGAGRIDTQVVSAYSQGPKLLTPAVEKALKESKFKPDCTGKTVAVVFRYELHGNATAHPKVTSRTDTPDIVYIESQPAAVTSATAKPQH
jgi:hypothetical protein